MIANSLTRKKDVMILNYGDDTDLLIDPALKDRLGLCADCEFDLPLLLRENEAFALSRAREYALVYLTAGARTEKQVRDHLLSKHLQRKAVDDTVKMLLSHNYINDKDYASHTTEEMLLSGKSRNRIESKLRDRGIGRELASGMKETVDNDTELKNLSAFLRKKNASLIKYPPVLRKEKLIRSAVSQGFSSSQTVRITEEILDEDENDYTLFYTELIDRRIRELMKKELTEKELRYRLSGEMRLKGAPPKLIGERLDTILNEEND